MRTRQESGLTIWEILVALVVLAILVSLMIPAISDSPVHIPQSQTISNMRQLYIATFTMANDGLATTNPALGWPGDTGGSFANWAETMLKENYIGSNDFAHLLSAPGRIAPRGTIPLTNNNAVLVYAVKQTSDSNTVFLTSANFTNTPTGGIAPLPESKPYGTKCFVVLRKGGDCVSYAPKQAGDTNIIGSYVPLLK